MGYLLQIQEEIESMKKHVNKSSEEAIKNIIKEYPNVSAVCWSQYVPYFNDGDPCEFTMGEIYILSGNISDEIAQKIADNPYYPDEYSHGETDDDGDKVEFKILSNWGEDKDDSAIEIVNFLSSIGDTLQSLYGSGASVVITKNGIITEEYESSY